MFLAVGTIPAVVGLTVKEFAVDGIIGHGFATKRFRPLVVVGGGKPTIISGGKGTTTRFVLLLG